MKKEVIASQQATKHAERSFKKTKSEGTAMKPESRHMAITHHGPSPLLLAPSPLQGMARKGQRRPKPTVWVAEKGADAYYAIDFDRTD